MHVLYHATEKEPEEPVTEKVCNTTDTSAQG